MLDQIYIILWNVHLLPEKLADGSYKLIHFSFIQGSQVLFCDFNNRVKRNFFYSVKCLNDFIQTFFRRGKFE